MRILIACEESRVVRDAFIKKGHDAYSCDIIAHPNDPKHINEDAFEVAYFGKWDMMIGHPPCTYLCKAQSHLCNKSFERSLSRISAIKFFKLLYNAPIEKIALENPSGAITSLFMPPTQMVQPNWFGSPYRKEICLWLKNLPKLRHTNYVTATKSMDNHVNSRMSQAERSTIKSKFFPEVAAEMAIQWG